MMTFTEDLHFWRHNNDPQRLLGYAMFVQIIPIERHILFYLCPIDRSVFGGR